MMMDDFEYDLWPTLALPDGGHAERMGDGMIVLFQEGEDGRTVQTILSAEGLRELLALADS